MKKSLLTIILLSFMFTNATFANQSTELIPCTISIGNSVTIPQSNMIVVYSNLDFDYYSDKQGIKQFTITFSNSTSNLTLDRIINEPCIAGANHIKKVDFIAYQYGFAGSTLMTVYDKAIITNIKDLT